MYTAVNDHAVALGQAWGLALSPAYLTETPVQAYSVCNSNTSILQIRKLSLREVESDQRKILWLSMAEQDSDPF